MKKRVLAVVIILVCLGGVACIKTLASGESDTYRCYGTGDVDCHGYKVDKMYSGYSLK